MLLASQLQLFAGERLGKGSYGGHRPCRIHDDDRQQPDQYGHPGEHAEPQLERFDLFMGVQLRGEVILFWPDLTVHELF